MPSECWHLKGRVRHMRIIGYLNWEWSGEWAADIGFILNLDLITHHMPVSNVWVTDRIDELPFWGYLPMVWSRSLCFRHDNFSIMSNMIENQSNGPSFLPFVCHHLLFLIPDSHSTTYAVYSTFSLYLLHSSYAIFVIQSSQDFDARCSSGWSMYTLYCYASTCVCL